MILSFVLCYILFAALIVEINFRPRLEWTDNKNLLLFYGKNRNYIILW